MDFPYCCGLALALYKQIWLFNSANNILLISFLWLGASDHIVIFEVNFGVQLGDN
jgi:hypothetical protein